jgi:hypothetical protein
MYCLAAAVHAFMCSMPTLTRQTKITFGEMRDSGVRGLLIYARITNAATRQ